MCRSAEGANTVRVVVTAQNGDTKIYEFTVTRAMAPADTDATLSSLTLEEATLNFVSTTYSYDVDVANGVTSATVRAVANSAAASLTVSLGSATATGGPDVKLTAPLVVGANEITVVVTAADNSEGDPYTITVDRAGYSPPVNVGGGGFGGFGGNTGSNTGGGGGGGGGRDETPTTEDETVGDPEPDSPYTDAGDAGTDTETAIRELHPLGVFTGTECEANRICPTDELTPVGGRGVDGADPRRRGAGRDHRVALLRRERLAHVGGEHVVRPACGAPG